MSTALPPIAGMTPRLVTTLHGSPSRVMQSFTRAPWEGTYFEARVEADAPLDMRITRCDSKGNALDFAVLKGAGHGSSITAEYDQGKVYIWLWWNIDSTTGATMTPVRWAYDGAPAGTTVLLADTETLSLPAGVIPGHFAIDQAADRIATYSRSGNTETLKLFRFTDFKTGTATALKTATVTKPNLSSFQGFTTSDVSAYISRGGSAPTDVAPIIYEVGWDAGGVVGSKDVSTLVLSGGVAPGGHNEAEGVCLWRDQSGNPTLLFGIVTGPAQQREGRIYAFAAPVDGTKTKTVQIDAERVIDGPATNVVAAFSYDRTVRYTTGGFTPTGYADPVKLSERSTAILNVSDHPDLTDDSYGFVIHVKLAWDDPADPGRRKTATYTAQLSAADPAVVNLSQALVATGAVAPGQVIAGAAGHSPVVTMVGDQIAVDGVTTGPHLTADATAAQQAAAQSAQAAAASAALVGAPAGTAIDAHLGPNGVLIPATITHADVQAALTTAATSGKRVQVGGSYTTNQTLTIAADCDLSNLVITYTGTGTAVQVGDGTVRPWKRLVLPRVINGAKAGPGWAAGTVGVRITNIQSCAQLIIPHVKGFETGVLFYGQGAGCVYNTVFVGHLENNKRNLGFDNDATGWANQSTFIGGRFSHDPAEGTPTAGTAHVWGGDSPNGMNNNTFVGCSLETPGVVEYMVDLGSSAYNQFINCRWEATSGTANVRWRSGASLNRIVGGYNVGNIVETRVAGSTRNRIESTTSDRVFVNSPTGIVAENTGSSANPIWTVVPAGTDAARGNPASVWTAALSASWMKLKSTADTNERIRIDYATGRVYFGPGGTVAPSIYIEGTTATIKFGGGHFIFDTDGTRDIGLSGSNRPRDVYLSRYVRFGSLLLGDFNGVAKISADGGTTWKTVALT